MHTIYVKMAVFIYVSVGLTTKDLIMLVNYLIAGLVIETRKANLYDVNLVWQTWFIKIKETTMKQFGKEYIVNFKQASEEVLNFIENYGFLTGSRFFEVHQANSDYDVVIDPSGYSNFCASLQHQRIDSYAADDVFNILIQHGCRYFSGSTGSGGHYRNETFLTLYALVGTRLYNIILPFTAQEYRRWEVATDMMKRSAVASNDYKNAIKDKEHRIGLFEQYKCDPAIVS